MPFGAVAAAAIGVVGSSIASRKASKASAKALRDADPFRSWRGQYAEDLSRLMADPNSITENPAYKFLFEQGMKATNRGLGARGQVGSGNQLTGLTEYGQGFASQWLDKERRFLAELSGAGIGPNAGAGVQAAQMGYENEGDIYKQLGYGLKAGIEKYQGSQGSQVDYFTDVTAQRRPEVSRSWGGIGGSGDF
jgi:hypothetical protein